MFHLPLQTHTYQQYIDEYKEHSPKRIHFPQVVIQSSLEQPSNPLANLPIKQKLNHLKLKHKYQQVNRKRQREEQNKSNKHKEENREEITMTA